MKLQLSLLVALTCGCAGDAFMAPAPTPFGALAFYDHAPTSADSATIAATGGTNIRRLQLANGLWFETSVNISIFAALPGVQAGRVDGGRIGSNPSNLAPLYVYYVSAATRADSALLDSLSFAPRSVTQLDFDSAVLYSTMQLEKIDFLLRDPNVRSVYIVGFIYPI